VRWQTYSYLPKHRASLPFDRYQIILLGEGQIPLGPVPHNFLVANVTRKLATCYEEVGRVANLLRGHYKETGDFQTISSLDVQISWFPVNPVTTFYQYRCKILHTILHRTELIIFPLTLQSSLLQWCLFEGRWVVQTGLPTKPTASNHWNGETSKLTQWMNDTDHVLVIQQMYDTRRPLGHRNGVGRRAEQMQQTQRGALFHRINCVAATHRPCTPSFLPRDACTMNMHSAVHAMAWCLPVSPS